MIFTLEVLQAKEGDCLLLHFGTKQKPRLAVIDGGPGQVFENTLRERLETMPQGPNNRLEIDLVMVSHVDADHITGIKKLFAEIESDLGNGGGARAFSVRRLWHNAFNDIIGDATDRYYKAIPKSKVTASATGAPDPTLLDDLLKASAKRHKKGAPKRLDPHDAETLGLILAGHADGRALRNSYEVLRNKNDIATLNTPFVTAAGRATLITDALAPVDVENVTVQILGPSDAEIAALQTAFDEYIETKGLSVASVLAAYADTSVTNLSSIVCLVTGGKKKSKTMLLTGDARGDLVLAALRKAGLLKKKKPLEVDVLKVPHHGSDRNIDPDLFENVIAQSYVFSGDGKHGNPERETLEMLFDARGKDAEYDVILTYDITHTDKGRKADFEKNERRKKDKAKRKKWSAAKQSIRALIAAKRKAKFKFNLIEMAEGAPHQIELGDEPAVL